MNKKGFTVIEILTTFLLITIVASLLIVISNSLNKVYLSSSVKTELYYKQSIISKELNESFLKKPVSSIKACKNTSGDKITNCIELTYSDFTTKIIKIEGDLIFIGDNTYELVKNSILGDIAMDIIYSPILHAYKPDAIFNLRIPITYKNIDGDFGINLVYQFNRLIVKAEL